MRLQNRRNCSCPTCGVRHVATWPGPCRSNRFITLFVADNFGRTCFERMFFQYLLSFTLQDPRIYPALWSCHHEGPIPIEAWHTWKVRNLCKTERATWNLYLSDSKFWGNFLSSKNDGLLDPYGPSKLKGQQLFLPLHFVPSHSVAYAVHPSIRSNLPGIRGIFFPSGMWWQGGSASCHDHLHGQGRQHNHDPPPWPWLRPWPWQWHQLSMAWWRYDFWLPSTEECAFWYILETN